MALGQEKLNLAIVDKLRTDTGAGSLVTLTTHDVTDPRKFRILRDRPPVKGESPFLGVKIFQSVPLSDDGPSHIQVARIHFRSYSGKDLTAMQIADRVEHLLHARDEQVADGTNIGFYDFSSVSISNRQTRWKSRDVSDFDNETDTWMTLVEAEVIWVDEPCP